MPLHPLLQPYKPSDDQPFNELRAAHLLNRAGFGGSPADVERVIKLGPERAVDDLMDFPDASADEQSETDVPDLSSIDGYPKSFRELRQMYVGKSAEEMKAIRQKIMMANREAIEAVITWWMQRMSNGPHPLQEKLTLFWHGHFTTSAKDEKAASLIWNQNELLRRQAAGNYREFLQQISRDPAMLDYLNNSENRKEHPNENYARELMELFTLGIGNYTEPDIKQAARAFTGWAHDGDDFVFRKFEHDTGSKTFLGYTGNLDGDDVIDVILHSKASMPFIAGELFAFFGYDQAEPAMLVSLGDLLRENNFELRPVIRSILTSKAFYSDTAIGTQIKSPIQLVVGTARLLDISMPSARQMQDSMKQMGQVPLMPPNVKGWPGGRDWINTSTLFVRYNTAVRLVGNGGNAHPLAGSATTQPKTARRNEQFDPATTGPKGTPEQVVDGWVSRLIQRPITDEKRQTLLDAMTRRPDDPQTIRRMVQLIVSMPDYQLC